ncbi:hypothetical protein [uncultured Microbacterium sp.]|uniref:hypothetical protein n=1 Tax=uncultured Microbacterium sp. TaxID=191216 RepID=UPI0028DBBF8C|nr:hypothetical protein [uncultured Microbacterium sp.]
MADETVFEVDDAVVLLLGAGSGGREQKAQIKGITRLEKLVFLLERETDAGKILTEDPQFKAYNFGPFSQKVYQAVDKLVAAGLLTDSKRLSRSSEDSWEAASLLGVDDVYTDFSTRDFELTDVGREYYGALTEELPNAVVRQAAELRNRFSGWRLRDLVRYVYERYDQFTEKSLIRDDILGKGR